MDTEKDDKASDEEENHEEEEERETTLDKVVKREIYENEEEKDTSDDGESIVIEEILEADSKNNMVDPTDENSSNLLEIQIIEENESSKDLAKSLSSEKDVAEYHSPSSESDEDDYDDDPTQCKIFNVIVMDEDEGKNEIIIDDSSDEAEEDGSPFEKSVEEVEDHLKVIAEEGYIVCLPNEVEAAAFKSNAVFDTDVKGSEWNVENNLEVSLNMATYEALDKLPDKNGAFIFNGHKYYIVKDRRPHITYYECWRSRRNGTCRVKCRVTGDGTVEIKGEHDHPPINLKDLHRTKFKQDLMTLSLSASKDVPLEDLYATASKNFPEGSRLLPFNQAKRLMELSRHTVYNTPLRKATQRLPGKYYPPDPERRVVTGRGFFLDGFKYYKMGNGVTHEVFRCANAKRTKCRVYCRVNKQDWSACVTGEHNHPSADGSNFLVSSFKLELRKALSDPANFNLSAKHIYDIASKEDPVGADLFPFKEAKQYIYMRKINTTPVPPTHETPNPTPQNPQYFIHQNYRYELLRKRTGKRTMYYKCKTNASCSVNLRILGDGTVVIVGKHSHDPEPEIENERQRLIERLEDAVSKADVNESLQQVYDTVMAEETPDKMLIYPWKQAWNLMRGIRKKKQKENPEIVEEIQEQVEIAYKEGEPLEENGDHQNEDNEPTPNVKRYQKVKTEPRGSPYMSRKPRGRMRTRMITDREQADAVENLLNYGRQVRKNISFPPKKRGRRRASYSVDVNTERVPVESDHSETMEIETIEENNIEEVTYQEVLVNVDGYMEPAVLYVDNTVVSEEVVVEETVQ